MVREIGILMSQPMIVAGLDKIKTQTRRTQGLEEYNKLPDKWHVYPHPGGGFIFTDAYFYDVKDIPIIDKTGKIPRYHVGDHLYWKETWRYSHHIDGEACPCYKADNMCKCGRPSRISVAESKWKSSTFMFKKDARIWSTVLKVEVQQLKAMTEEDAMDEGVTEKVATYLGFSCVNHHPGDGTYYRNIYKYLWAHLNGTWLPDLWVWKYTMTEPEVKVG